MSDNLDGLLKFASDLARDAGKIMLQYFDASNQAIETKADSSPVTIADKKINQLVIDRVTKTFQSHGVLAEEGSSHEDRKELWVCDPIDGTVGYILGMPTALFSLAFVVDGQPEIAVIFDPYQNKLYSATHGQGAKVNNKSLSVSNKDKLAGANIAISASYSQLKDRQQLYDQLPQLGLYLQLIHGNVFKSVLVASGKVDGYIFPGRSAHDIAASKLIVEEAGGRVTDLNGNEQRYDGPIFGAIISNGRLHDRLVELVQDFGSENYIGY